MKVKDLAQRLLEHMGFEKIQIDVEEGEFFEVSLKTSEEESGLLIGYHGETLAAIQKFLQMATRESGEEKKIVVNINDYKERRKLQLEEEAAEIARQVIELGRVYVYGYLPANERLIIHQYISGSEEFKDELESISSGEGSARRLELRPRKKSSTEKTAA